MPAGKPGYDKRRMERLPAGKHSILRFFYVCYVAGQHPPQHP